MLTTAVEASRPHRYDLAGLKLRCRRIDREVDAGTASEVCVIAVPPFRAVILRLEEAHRRALESHIHRNPRLGL
jgi:hypothetical protein